MSSLVSFFTRTGSEHEREGYFSETQKEIKEVLEPPSDFFFTCVPIVSISCMATERDGFSNRDKEINKRTISWV